MRVWALANGVHELAFGPDADEDERLDAALWRKTAPLAKGAPVALTVPPRQLTLLEITRKTPGPSIYERPDLAVTTTDMNYDAAAGALTYLIHNVGARPARDATVTVRVDGRETATHAIRLLESPDDLVPRTRTFTQTGLKAGQTVTVAVDAENKIPEIWEENNEATFRIRTPGLLANPGFEAGLAGWRLRRQDGADAECAVSSDQARTGSSSIRLRKLSGVGAVQLTTSDPVPVTPGREHHLCAFRRLTAGPPFNLGASGCRAFLEVIGLTQAGEERRLARNSTRQSVPVRSRPGEWAPLRLWFTPPPDIRAVRPVFTVHGAPCELRLDDFSLRLYDPAQYTRPYAFDPPQPQVDWDAVLAALAQSSDATGEIRTVDGTPRLFIDGRARPPILHKLRGKRNHGYCADFSNAGIGVQMVTVPIGGLAPEVWKGPGDHHFEPIDARIKFALRGAPDAFLILVLRLHPYAGWEEAHPDSVCRDHNGLPAMGRFEREYFGTKRGEHDRPVASYYSAALRGELKQVLAAVLEFLKKQPYYKRVVGFSLAGGHDGQWRTQAMVGRHLIDYCPDAVRAFRAFMRGKYGAETELGQALGDPQARYETLAPPSADRRLAGLFRDPAADRLLADYSEFLSAGVADALIDFAKLVKDSAGKPMLVQTYYNDVIKGMASGYNAARRLHRSPHVDMLGAPAEYNPWRQPGGPGGVSACLAAMRRHNMIWLQELDLRTWVAPRYNPQAALELAFAEDIRDFRAISRREIGAMIAQGMGAYYYDLVGGYFHEPRIMAEIAHGHAAYATLAERPNRFRPDVAVIVDEDSCHWVSEDVRALTAVNACLAPVHDAFCVSGVPFDVYQLDDLLEFPDLCDYKAYFFLTAFRLTSDQRSAIDRRLKRDGKTLVWQYAPGYLDEKRRAPELIEELTGFRVETSAEMRVATVTTQALDHAIVRGLPPVLGRATAQPFRIAEAESVVPFARAPEDGKVVAALKQFPGWRSIYVATPGALPADLINNIASLADAYVCCRAGLPVWVNDHFISVHGTQPGPVDIRLPRPASEVRDAATGRPLASADGGRKLTRITIDLPLQETRWLLLE